MKFNLEEQVTGQNEQEHIQQTIEHLKEVESPVAGPLERLLAMAKAKGFKTKATDKQYVEESFVITPAMRASAEAVARRDQHLDDH